MQKVLLRINLRGKVCVSQRERRSEGNGEMKKRERE